MIQQNVRTSSGTHLEGKHKNQVDISSKIKCNSSGSKVLFLAKQNTVGTRQIYSFLRFRGLYKEGAVSNHSYGEILT
jgi:hypothetical protein